MEYVPAFPGEVSRVVFSGRFGSGKTEIAINYALRWAQKLNGQDTGRKPPVLIDLDIVTPYFRTREIAEEMRKRGLEVASPAPVAQYLDTPGIRPEILGWLQQTERPVILDVGGDEQGARALGQYSGALRHRGYLMYLVVNPYRPFTKDTEGIREAIRQIERASHLFVTGLVSNPNLMEQTTAEVFAEGQSVVELASRQLELPLAFTAVESSLLRTLAPAMLEDTSVLPLERFFALPWADAGGGVAGSMSEQGPDAKENEVDDHSDIRPVD